MVLVLISTNYPYRQRSLPSFDAQIPLKNVEVRGEMIDFVGRVKITQTFINNYPRNIEAKYLFNLTEDSTVVGMTMQIGDRVLVSHVEEKTEARATYETAISEKKTTCLLEKSAANGIYTVQVGNILQGQEIKIEIEYLTQLECSDEGEMKFVLPTNISPKYEAAQKSIVDVMDQRNTMGSLSHASHVPFTFKLDLVWKSNNQIKEVKSLTNDISVSGIDDRTVRVVCETAPRNGDFNILVTTDVTPTLYVSQQGADSFLMINHRIKDEVLDIEGGEYIILVDRSGSMGDSFSKWSGSDGRTENNKKKIDYAREATRLFVQSLPAGCSFNVVSFGSSYETLFPSSVEYNDITSQQALKQIAQFQANMGGTELFQCLSDVLSGQRNRNQSNSNQAIDLNKRSWKPNNSSSTSESGPSSTSTKKSTEKIVILMTDGDVGNVDSVVGLIKQYSYNSRVFTIGIGQDVNRFLCEKVAGASNACSEILVDNPNISMVVAKMLDAATKSYYKHSTLILPQGRRVEIDKPIYPNRFCTFFHKLPTAELTAMMSSVQSASSTEFMMIVLESVDGISQAKCRWSLPVVSSASSQLMDSSIIPRLYAADLIRSLEEANGNHRHTQEIIRVSCEYGIMNERTSFVVVDERENRSIRGAPLPVTVPQVAAGSASLSTGKKYARGSSSSNSSYLGAQLSRRTPGTVSSITHDLDDVHDVLSKSISDLNQRAECLDLLHEQCATLKECSVQFNQKASTRNSSRGLFGFFGSNTSSAPPPPLAEPPKASGGLFGGLFGSAAPPPPPMSYYNRGDGVMKAEVTARVASFDESEADDEEVVAQTVSNINIETNTSTNTSASKGLSKEDTLDQLINFKVSDGSFTYNPQSLQLTPWSRADLQRLISEQQHYQSAAGSGWTWSESLMFNVLILKLLKEVGSKKYVMIVRNLEKWLEKQFQPQQLSSSPLPSLLQTIVV